MMDVNLLDFLLKVSQNLPCLTYISTHNSSFPKEYRFTKIFSWELIDSLSDDILQSHIKSINGTKDLLYKIMRDSFETNNFKLHIEVEIYNK